MRWSVLVSPFKHSGPASQKGYFSTALESVRKDVECTFGILKKRWKALEYGIRFDDINVVERVFRGCPIGTDAIWLSVPNDGVSPRIATQDDKVQANLWAKRRHALSEHVEYVSRELKRRRFN